VLTTGVDQCPEASANRAPCGFALGPGILHPPLGLFETWRLWLSDTRGLWGLVPVDRHFSFPVGFHASLPPRRTVNFPSLDQHHRTSGDRQGLKGPTDSAVARGVCDFPSALGLVCDSARPASSPTRASASGVRSQCTNCHRRTSWFALPLVSSSLMPAARNISSGNRSTSAPAAFQPSPRAADRYCRPTA